ncbi:methyl-accepting chemotaxis protein [Gammaproteobacteria bacterium]
MFKNIKIRNKIIVAIAAILVATLLAVTLIVSVESGRWFTEEAEAKLGTAAKVVLADISSRVEKMTRDINILAEDDTVISQTCLIRDFVNNNPTQGLDDAYTEITKELALRFKKISDTRQGFQLIRLYDANANLIAFYEKAHRLAGWYKGDGKFSGMKGNNKLLPDAALPDSVGTRYPTALPEKSATGFDIFANHLEIVAHNPVYEKVGSKMVFAGLIVVDTFFDSQYAEDMSALLNSQINFFRGQDYVAGVIEGYSTISKESYQALQSQYPASAKPEDIRPLNRSTIIDGKGYYEELFPFGKDGKVIGAMSIVYSKEYATAKKMNAVMLLSILAALSFVVGIGVAVAFSHAITQPMKAAVEISNQLANGDLRVEIEVKGRDETGQLLAAMKNMVGHFKDMLASVRHTADTVALTSHELHDRSQRMTAGLTGQADKVTQIATASTEMSQTVIDIAKNAMSIASSAAEAAETAKKGESIVKRSIEEVRSIASTVREAAQMVNSLGGRSRQVGEIVGVINDVADQTNLLALNAAIEAARAGESGRGFAVVADEVKKLAERTAQATAEIRNMIKDMQNEVHRTVEAMAEGTRRVEVGAELSTQAGLALGDIVTSVAALQNMIEQIAAATEEMSVVSEQTNRDIVEVSTVSQDAVSSFSEISQSAANMTTLSTKLQNKMGRFHIGAG